MRTKAACTPYQAENTTPPGPNRFVYSPSAPFRQAIGPILVYLDGQLWAGICLALHSVRVRMHNANAHSAVEWNELLLHALHQYQNGLLIRNGTCPPQGGVRLPNHKSLRMPDLDEQPTTGPRINLSSARRVVFTTATPLVLTQAHSLSAGTCVKSTG